MSGLPAADKGSRSGLGSRVLALRLSADQSADQSADRDAHPNADRARHPAGTVCSAMTASNNPVAPVNLAPVSVCLREVGLRDGLQAIARTLPTDRKLAWIAAAHAAGLREIEVGSFVPPRLLPQLADTADLVAFAKTLPGLSTSVLVPNLGRAAEPADPGRAHRRLAGRPGLR